MDDTLRALILGIVQGLTEFIPVSSSGHLILVPALFGWEDQGLAFDAGLHLGTLVAVLVYFWRDWWRMAVSLLSDVSAVRSGAFVWSQPSRLALSIAAATVPVAVVGVLLSSPIDDNLREPWLVAIALAVVAVVFIVVERRAPGGRSLGQLRFNDAMIIGVAQIAALMPGVSRSGATLSTGMLRGLEREDAARFAFLLGAPALAGAGLFAIRDMVSEDSFSLLQFAVGAGASGIVGLAAIHFLLEFLRRHTLIPFAGYRVAVAALTLAIGAARVA